MYVSNALVRRVSSIPALQPQTSGPARWSRNTAYCAAAEHEQIAAMLITLQILLHHQCQALHPRPHIRLAQRDPQPRAGRCHRRAFKAAASNLGDAAAKMLGRLPRGSSMTIAGCSAAPATTASPSITASANTGAGSARHPAPRPHPAACAAKCRSTRTGHDGGGRHRQPLHPE